MSKLKKLLKNKKMFVCMAIMCLCLALGSVAFAGSGESAASNLDFSVVTNALTAAVTPADILTIISKVIVIGIPFVLAWFGFRFLWSKFRGAVTRGKM